MRQPEPILAPNLSLNLKPLKGKYTDTLFVHEVFVTSRGKALH